MNHRFRSPTPSITLFARLARYLIVVGATVAMLVISAGLVPAAAQEHHHHKLIDLGTLGGPQSYGDGGHNAANITNQGIAAGVADTAIRDPFYPNFNPNFAGNIGLNSTSPSPYPFAYHVFVTKGGALVDLGGLFSGGDSTAVFITENGLVSGSALNGMIDPLAGVPAESPVLWMDGHIINLGNLGGYEGVAGRVNSRGQVTGIATNAIPDPFSYYYSLLGLLLGIPNGIPNGTQTRVFLWDEKNGMQDIGTLGGPDASGAPVLINERGQIVGFSYTSFEPNAGGGPTTDPFLWEKGRMIDLGTLGGTAGFPNDLNNRGQVVGSSNLAGDLFDHPFLWTAPGPMRDLGTLGGPTGQAFAINESGEVIGFADTASSTDAFLWRKGVMTDLGTLEGDCFSGAFGINARTQVTGQSITCDFTGARAFMWENGTMIDLNVFVPPGVNLTLVEVEQINDRGEMFGGGTLATGESRAFLLIPCDENHPNIEGCDYSPMEVSTVAGSHSAPQKQLTPQEISRIHAMLMNRHRGFMPRPMH